MGTTVKAVTPERVDANVGAGSSEAVRLVQRIQAEFQEMPGLRLTLRQASRVFGLDARQATQLLGALLDDGFLVCDARGALRRQHAQSQGSLRVGPDCRLRASGVRGVSAAAGWRHGPTRATPAESIVRHEVMRQSREEIVMPDIPDQTPHRRPHAQPAAARYLELDVARELEQLHREPEWTGGRNAKTLVKQDTLRIVLMVLKAQARVPEHRTDGRLSIQTVRGRIVVRADGRTFDLPAGSLLALDQGVPHDVEALEESAFLLTIAWPGRHAEPPAA
jgi:quercetin dioxygenase-like cupin family protein